MTPRTQIAVSLLALGCLLGSAVSSYATNIAELPLKASVLAKPNVIFGLDDSGSMDSEVMINTNDGAFWWDYNAKSGWDSSGKPWFNSVGDSSTQWRKMVNLFPNGQGTGVRTYADAANDHFAIPPTSQFAFLRSSSFNPLYYNPAVTYAPWSPAYIGSAVTSFADASTTAAKSHPTKGSGTMDLSAIRTLSTATNTTFMALPGMTVPAGSQTCVHNNGGGCTGGWTVEAAARTVPAATVLRLAMEYYPATYYVKESCTLSADVCVAAPDGSTLQRYEIKAGNTFPSGRPYRTSVDGLTIGELDNFANWWQYHRKRKLMLSAAIGKVLEPLTGLRIGVVKFNNRSTATMYDIDSLSPSTNGLKVAGIFYETDGSGGTPTRNTLKYIGEEYRNTAGTIQYACQRNNAFIVTDGFANNGGVTPPSYSQATWGAGVPYETTYADTLADIALSYYTTNLIPGMATGMVPSNTVDTNTNLHMNTYGLTLGAVGTIFANESTPLPALASDWPNPTANRSPTAVDDLWHATINGRGKMYLATTPQETALRIQAGLTDILSQTGAQGGIAVSTVNLPRGDSKAYFGKYNPAGWAGDLTANTIDAATGTVSTTASWSAAQLLAVPNRWLTRIVATSNGSGPAVDFNATNVGSTVNPSLAYGTDAAVIDYLRGDRSGEGTAFRTRTSLMGAVINSEPVVSRDDAIVYVASGEGMLHAFDTSAANAGKELWAFVPRLVLPNIGATVQRGYSFRTKLDGSPVLGKYSSTGKLLVAGMGVAGRGYVALDVTSPRVSAASQLPVKWEFPSAGDATKVGQTLGRPVIVKTQSNGYVVLVTSGYNNTADGKGRLWMLNADTGAVIKEFTTPDGNLSAEAGLAHVAGFAETNGTVQFAYGGDLLGNVWSFDLNATGSTPAPTKLTSLIGPAGDAQPITAAPELVMNNGVRTVMVGTGRLLDISDFGSTKVQSIYAIADGAPLPTPRTTLVQQTYNRATDSMSTNAVNWASNRGWFIDLPAGEQINTRPTIAYGGLAFVSNVNGGSDCSASAWLYVVDALTGTKFVGTTFVGTQLSNISTSSGVTALLTTGQKIVGAGQDADGRFWDRPITSGKTIQPSKNSWLEIRR